MMRITPSVGRIVHYYEHNGHGPFAAIITKVKDDDQVAVRIFELDNGFDTVIDLSVTVPLIQPLEPSPLGQAAFVCWPPTPILPNKPALVPAARDVMVMDPGDIARVCHEINRAYCQALGDTSQAAWADAPQWQVDSAIQGVLFHLRNPDAGPDASHKSWLNQKANTGWTYGETKDADKKTHPCMVPFEDLPVEQQAKDHLFRAVVHMLLPWMKPQPN